MNFELITHQVINLCRTTGAYIEEQAKRLSVNDIKEKGAHNFVTYVDRESEKRLVKELSRILPQAGIIAEEGTYNKGSKDFTWVIDPLDGTTNFIHGVPFFSISVALLHRREAVLGVVYEINRRECFYAWKGSEAYLNRKKITVTDSTDMKKCLLVTGFPYEEQGKLHDYLDIFHELTQASHGIRRLGSAAADLAYVACGRFDGFYEYGLNPWDVAAGAFIVKQAGGKVTDFSNGEEFLFGKEIIASNGLIHGQLYEAIRRYFGPDEEND